MPSQGRRRSVSYSSRPATTPITPPSTAISPSVLGGAPSREAAVRRSGSRRRPARPRRRAAEEREPGSGSGWRSPRGGRVRTARSRRQGQGATRTGRDASVRDASALERSLTAMRLESRGREVDEGEDRRHALVGVCWTTASRFVLQTLRDCLDICLDRDIYQHVHRGHECRERQFKYNPRYPDRRPGSSAEGRVFGVLLTTVLAVSSGASSFGVHVMGWRSGWSGV